MPVPSLKLISRFQWYIQTMWRPKSSTGAATWRYDPNQAISLYNPVRSNVPGVPAIPSPPPRYVSEHFGWVAEYVACPS